MVDKTSLTAGIYSAAEEFGSYEANGFCLELGDSGDPEIKVRELATGFLVAYSSMEPDYESSMEEFIMDYFVRPLD